MDSSENHNKGQVELADKEAIIEHAFNVCMSYGTRSDPNVMAEAIREVGAEHCVMSTDFGQWHNSHPIEGIDSSYIL